MEGIKEENAEEDEESEAAQPSPLLPPDLHLNTSTPPCGGVRPPPTAAVAGALVEVPPAVDAEQDEEAF